MASLSGGYGLARLAAIMGRDPHHGLIERIPKTHRYRITPLGLRTALFCTRLYNRALRQGFAIIAPNPLRPNLPLARAIRVAEQALDQWYQDTKLAA